MNQYIDPITTLAERAIAEKVFPGCVVGIVNSKGDRLVLPFGRFTYEPDSPEVKADTMYDVASITKSIPTACLALQLLEEGKIDLEDKLIKYVPEFRNSDREEVKIKHLLTYQLDGYGMGNLLKDRPDMIAQELFEILMIKDFEKRPGEIFKYTNVPAALLGLVIERVTGKTLDVLADEKFFRPLAMSHTTFHPEKFSLAEIVPTEVNEWFGMVHGHVHDESAWICKREGKVVGHAGLFSTVPDLLNFLEMLLKGGSLHGVNFFNIETIEKMHTNQIEHLNFFTGLGFELNQPQYMGKFCSTQTFGKTGFTGTVLVCDREKDIAYVILSNRTYPQRPADSSAINRFRKAVGEVILASI